MDNKYEILDANKSVYFKDIRDALKNIVGQPSYSCFWPSHDGNGKFRIWFPEIADGYYVLKQEVEISKDWNLIIRKEKYGLLSQRGICFTGYNLVFVKEPDFGPYVFRGVYVRDDIQSSYYETVYKRIATRVRIVGENAIDIEILDEIKPSKNKDKYDCRLISDRRKVGIAKPEYILSRIPEIKLKKRIIREFSKKKMLGDISINDDEYDIILDYFKQVCKYICDRGIHEIVNPVFSVALVQIGIRCYDGAFWPHVKKLLGVYSFPANHQGWIGASFIKTLKDNEKIHVGESDRVDSILMHGFVSDAHANNFFNFLYAFYKIDLDRDVSRLDKQTLNNLMSIIKKNDNTGRTYFLVEHTADAVRLNERGAKNRIRRFLNLIDKAFWGESLPSSSDNRLIQKFLDWKDSAAEFLQERAQYGGSAKKGKKAYASPYIKYYGNKEIFGIILPSQIIRFDDFKNLFWLINSDHINGRVPMNPYAQGVTGYKTEEIPISLSKEALFDAFTISWMDDDTKIRSFRISSDVIRFFDNDGDGIRNDSLQPGISYSFTRSGEKPKSEAILESYDDGILNRTTYDFINGDIVRVPDGKPIVVGGKLREGILPRGKVSGVIAGYENNPEPVYKEMPSILVRLLPQRANGTSIRINKATYHFSAKDKLHEGISEFDLKDRTGEKGYIIDLSKFGCRSDGRYSINFDVPNDRTIRNWNFVLISNLDYEFEEAPYIFKTRGTIRFPKDCLMQPKNDCKVEIQDSRRIDFDIIPGEGRIYFDYKGIDIGFDVPTLSYQFSGENWLIAPHRDIWHSDFNPQLSITYDSDKLRIFLDDDGEYHLEEHGETYTKTKSKGIFECDLNRFKSWFGRKKEFRQIFLDLPGVSQAVPLVRIFTQSIFKSGLLKGDFNNHKLIGDFEIVGYSEYYVDIEFKGEKIYEKIKLEDKHLDVNSELKTGVYKITVFESEEDEFGFGEPEYYEIGSIETELLNPTDLSGMNIEITSIHPASDDASYLPLSCAYTIVDLKIIDEGSNCYKGKMIVNSEKKILATFPAMVEFFDLNRLQMAYITFIDEDENCEFFYDEYKCWIVKQEDRSLPKSHAYRRYSSLFPEDFVFNIKFIQRPKNAGISVNDEAYNNLKINYRMKNLMSTSIFG